MDVIVVGGGVMGASVAYQLALRGRRSVVLEAETLAHGASGNAAGLVSPPRDGGSLGSDDPATAAAWFDMRKTTFEMHQELAETLPEQAGMGYGWTVKPSIGVAITEEEEGRARRELASMEAMGIPASWLTPAEIRAACPAFDGERIRGGVLSADPGTHPLIPPRGPRRPSLAVAVLRFLRRPSGAGAVHDGADARRGATGRRYHPRGVPRRRPAASQRRRNAWRGAGEW